MAQFTAEFWQDLRKPMRDRYGGAVLYTGNASANVLTVHLTENGEPYTGGGTISGTAIRANSTTVPLTDGSISADGTITVTLIPNCYLVAGYLHVYINVTTGSTVTTVLSVIYSVNATSSGTPIDPSGEITLDVNTLVNKINTATATIPASYETLMYSVAPAYSDLDFPIDAGLQLCWYDGQLYVNNVDIAAAESWTPAHWDACDVSGQLADVLADVSDLKSNFAENQSVYGNEYDISDIQIGKNWAGGSASNRAVLYVPVESETEYYISLPSSTKFSGIQALEKAANQGSYPIIATTNINSGTSAVITTTATTTYICMQYVSDTDITQSDVEGYDVYFRQGSKKLTTMVDAVARASGGVASFDTFHALAVDGKTGLSRVGGAEFRNIVASPTAIQHTQPAHANPYFDVNSTIKEYQTVTPNRIVPYENILNNLPQEEIDFTPSDNGFTRIIVGKDNNDLFFVAYVASNRVGAFGDPKYDALEVTSDFETFTTVLRSSQLSSGDGIVVPNMTNLKVLQVKQFADGSYLVAMKSHNVSADNDYTHFYKLSADMQTITHMQYTNFNGQTVDMTDEFNGDVYDWSVFVAGEKALAVTYGTRNPETDYGRVWYTENNGNNWKQVFQTNNHLQEGQAPGVTVTQAHTHGVMIDPYSGRLFVLVGEDNRNIFWTDKGINATDSDWNVISLATQSFYNFQDGMQIVNGYPFDGCLVFGSDSGGIGCVYRLNKLDDGSYSPLESAHEFLPNMWDGVYYCAADMSRRDLDSPLLMCETHESARFTEENNELLNLYHKARVVATYDGINFTEVWTDDTYGAHNAYIDGSIVSRNYSWCTRGMNCWLLNNGDAVIKYSNRDYYYFGGEPMFSVQGISNGCSKVRVIKGAEKYLKA